MTGEINNWLFFETKIIWLFLIFQWNFCTFDVVIEVLYEQSQKKISRLKNKQKIQTEEVTTSVFITAIWTDYRLAWDPEEFGGLTESRIPSLQIWRPDIVLYNNDDGNYDPTLPTNVVLKNTGVCEWLPPEKFLKQKT